MKKSSQHARRLGFEFLESRQMLAADSVHFTFDYSNDNGFFSGANFFRRELLERAGEIWTDRLQDKLASVPASTPALTWTAQFENPSTGRLQTLPTGFSAKANEIVVFAGTRNLASVDTDARAYAVVNRGQPVFQCAAAGPACNLFFNNLRTRGQGETVGAAATDFAPIFASISFDNRADTTRLWNFENEPLKDGQLRFLSFATHELGHVLGFGQSDSFITKAAGGRFSAKEANRVFGGPVPLNGQHLNASVTASEPSLMTSFTPNELPSELDFAIVKDVGWVVTPDVRPVINFATTSAFVYENASQPTTTTIEVIANLSKSSTTAIEIPFQLSGAAATDIVTSQRTFKFAPNQTIAALSIEVIGDSVDETTEAVTLSLVDSIAVKTGPKRTFRLTVFDDDGIDLMTVPVVDLETIGNTLSIPGDNRPRAVRFRATADRTLRVTAAVVDQISEAVLLIDRQGRRMGDLGSTGIASATLQKGNSYALVFYPRLTNRTFNLDVSGGFASLAEATRTNVLFPTDVNDDGQTLASDALQIINQINRAGGNSQVDSNLISGDGFYDVSGDGNITPIDALQVINYLNQQDITSSEPALRSQYAPPDRAIEAEERFNNHDEAIIAINQERKIVSF